jgi:hypothetical protein
MTLTLKDSVAFFKRYPIGVACGLLSVIALVGYFVRSTRASELSDQLKDVETQGERIQGDIHNATDLVAHCSTLTAATKELESRLVRGSERAHNQQYFYEIESETGVREVSLQPNGADPKKGANSFCYGIGYTVTVEGNFRQLLDFVGRLESGHYFYRLISASASRKGDRNVSGSGAVISLTLNLELLGLP